LAIADPNRDQITDTWHRIYALPRGSRTIKDITAWVKNKTCPCRGQNIDRFWKLFHSYI